MMRNLLMCAALLAVPATALLAQEAETEKAEQRDRAEVLVEQFLQPNLDLRDDARRGLIALGKEAVPHVRRALRNAELPEPERALLRDLLQELPQVAEEVRSSSSMRIRIAPRGEGDAGRINVESDASGTRTEIISRDTPGLRHVFAVCKEGKVTVTVTRDEEVTEHKFASIQEMRRESPDLYEVYDSSPLHILPAPPKVEPDHAMQPTPEQEEALEREDERTRRQQEREAREQDFEVSFAEGDLTEAEANALSQRARERLMRDQARLDDREARNAERGNQAEARDITRARYRASLRALERDLLLKLSNVRRADGHEYKANLDAIEDRIKDTFGNLHDRVADGGEGDWKSALEAGRKFHEQFSKDIELWAEKIGVPMDVPNAPEAVRALRKDLNDRIRRLHRIGGERYADALNGVSDRVRTAFNDIEKRLETTLPESWAEVLETAESFHARFSADLDRWSREMGADEALPSPLERVAELRKDLNDRIRDLRRLGGEEYEREIRDLELRMTTTFMELRDRILHQSRNLWAQTLEDAVRFHKQYADLIDLWEQRVLGIVQREDVHEESRPPRVIERPERGPVEVVERDVELKRGEHMDIIEGVRVARLMPLPRRQLGLENGLSVNEIVDADKALARAGLEVYDIILKINDEDMDTRTGLRGAMNALERGEEFTITILRDGERKELKGRK